MTRNRILLPDGDLWLSAGGEDVLGGRRLALLEAIAESGSITMAGKAVGISYRTAWDAVERLNALAEKPLVESSAGGRRGGGTRLTGHGREVLAVYEAYRREHGKFLESLRRGGRDFGRFQLLARKASLKISARNQIWGKVESIRGTALIARVSLRIGRRDLLRAEITRAGLEALGMAVGDEVYALVKANWIGLAAAGRPGAAAGNRIPGTLVAVDRRRGAFEATLETRDGLRLTAAGTEEGVSRWRAGQEACAVFDPSDVILGVTS